MQNDLARGLKILLAAISIGLFALIAFDLINFTVDDVFIVLRYAQNIALGKGFVYNIGERVEGYSDLFWLLLLTIPYVAGIIESQSSLALIWCAKALSLAFAISTLVTLYALTKRFLTHHGVSRASAGLWGWGAVLALSTCGPFVLWAVGGLETTLAAFYLTLLSLLCFQLFVRPAASKQYFLIGALLGLGITIRPEFALHSAVVFVLLAKFTRKSDRKLLGWMVVPALLLVLAFLGFRWFQFHALVPNTFTAKTGAPFRVLGIKYSLTSLAAILGPLLLATSGIALDKMWKRKEIVLLLWIIATSYFFSFYASGDWMAGFRFLIPAAPLMIFIGVIGLRTFVLHTDIVLHDAHSYRLLGLFLVMAAISTALLGRTLVRDQSPTMDSGFTSLTGYSLKDHAKFAHWLRVNFPDSVTVGMNEAGLIGYLNPQLTLIDFAGLMDKHIANDKHQHKPLDVKYVLAHKPQVLMFTGWQDHHGKVEEMDYLPEFLKDTNFCRNFKLDTIIGGMMVYQRLGGRS